MRTGETKYDCDVLIVDDDEFNLVVAADILREEFSVYPVSSGQEALDYLRDHMPKLILLDIYMPEMDGRETLRRIRANSRWKNIPIIFLTADHKPETEKECLMLGAADFVTKPYVPMVMRSRIGRTIELAGLQEDLETRLEEKTRLVEKVSLNAIMTIANTIDAKDEYTAGHSRRVAKCSTAIARQLHWPEQEIQNLDYIALLHDIGKIGVPDSILNKPSRLSNEEFAIIKSHPVIGNNVLKDVYMIKNVAEGALYHHERYDGLGYPFGIKGQEIPLCARIIGIADAYDAMTSNRIYRHKLDRTKVIEEFENGRGTQFDPELTDLFLDMLRTDFHVTKTEEERSAEDGAGSENSTRFSMALTAFSTDMQEKVTMDELTRLHSRTYAESRIVRLLEEKHYGTLLVMDMDNFRQVNELFGHIAGDMVLKTAADALRAGTSGKDVLCRLGGDEFMIFLTDVTERNEVEQKIRAIQENFAGALKDLDCENATSLSVGIAISPVDGKNFEMLLNGAEKALYFVKHNRKGGYAFYRQETGGERGQKTTTDLKHIRSILEGRIKRSEQGAFRVRYEDFDRIYGYIQRGVRRNRQQVQTLLFTLSTDDDGDLGLSSEEPMKTLELAAASSLRMVDVGTRYSSMQYIVILVDTDLENGKKVADRVAKQFYRMYGGRGVVVSYDIQTMQAGPADEE